MSAPKSLYIHIPFCAKKCHYCDFYSLPLESGVVSEYMRVLCAQIKGLEGVYDTLYVGGGTPSALEIRDMVRFFSLLSKKVNSRSEFTVEVNPESFSRDKMRLFFDSGVNRLSFGLQSQNPDLLARLGRSHTPGMARKIIEDSYVFGFKNISADCIFAIPGQTLAMWEKELKNTATLPLTHISAYALTYEKGTPLGLMIDKKTIKPVSEFTALRQYVHALRHLPPEGFSHYEVSNFSRAGYESRHNLNYWINNDYQALGASAVSYVDGVRKRCVADVNNYISFYRQGKNIFSSSERLSRARRAKEAAALKIRTSEGISFQWFRQAFGFDFLLIYRGVIGKLISNNLIKRRLADGSLAGVCLTEKGFIYADEVSSALV